MKKISRLLIALVLAFSLLGCAGSGSGNETPEAETTAPEMKVEHTFCTGAHTGNITWLPWGKGEGESKTLPDGGYYYLEKDIDLSGVSLEIHENTAICLNGNDIKGDIPVKVSAELAISDHTAKTKSNVYKAGKILLNVDHPCTDSLFKEEKEGWITFYEGINTNSDMEKDVNLYKPTAEEAATREIDIFILAGQSNASGSTPFAGVPVEEQDKNQYKNVRYYYHRTQTDGKIMQNEVGLKAVKQGFGANANYVGPELGMARVLNPLYPTSDRKAVIFKSAVGASSLLQHEDATGTLVGNATAEVAERFYTRGSWYPEALQSEEVKALGENRPTGYLTREFRRDFRDFYEKLLKAGYKTENIHVISISWMQGESDRGRPAVYSEAMGLFMTEMRGIVSEITGEDYSLLPFIIGEVSRTATAPTAEQVEKNSRFILMQDMLPTLYPAVAVIPTGEIDMTRMTDDGIEYIAADGIHWAYPDILKVGELFAEGSLHPESCPYTNLK